MSRSSVRELPVFVIGESEEISVNWPGSRGNGVESRVLVLEDYVVFSFQISQTMVAIMALTLVTLAQWLRLVESQLPVCNVPDKSKFTQR